MEAAHIYHQIRPPSPPAADGGTTKSPERPSKMSSRLRGSSRSEEECARLGSRLHSRRRSSSSGGGQRSRSAHPPFAPGGGREGSEKSSPRSPPSTLALRPLPPAPPPARYHFGCLLRNGLPPMPPGLVAKTSLVGSRTVCFANSKAFPSAGDVKVILCVKMPTISSAEGTSSTPCVSIDARRKQVTLVHPALSRRRFGLAAPKMFSFDAVFTQDDPLAEVCSAALTDAVYSVVRGADSCVLCLGHAKTLKSRTMLGSDASVTAVGVIPCAIAWLFRLVEEQKETTKTRFSVRVSAVEVFGNEESYKDLLQESALHDEDDQLLGPAPSSYLRNSSPNSHTRTMSLTGIGDDSTPAARLSRTMDSLTEIRTPTAGHAAHLLDVALANRAQNVATSHTLFTLHVYQYKVEKNGSETEVSGGRSRLQLLYLGCGRYGSKEAGQPQDQPPTTKSLSLANIANVLLGLLTGQRQLPHRESAVTQLLREGMTGNHAQPCIIAHASGQQQHYSETLQVVQLASRLHRLRRRRVGNSGGGTCGGSSWTAAVGDTASDSSTSSRGFRSRLSIRPRLGRSSFGTSTTDYTSSSEQSCTGDTVIYLGGGVSETESSLGPRGLADGSVVHSADEWKKCASSGEEGTLRRSSVAGKSRLGGIATQAEGATLRQGGLIKRVTPRTNATAWPRAAAVRKGKEVVSSTEETWVDGPNAMVVEKQQCASVRTANTSSSEDAPPPAPPYFGFAHRIVPQHPLAPSSDVAKVYLAPEEPTAPHSATIEVVIKEPTYASIDEVKGCVSGESSVTGSCTLSSSSSDGEDNEDDHPRVMKGADGDVRAVSDGAGGGSRGFGVLSDISERTEETEGGTSAPSSVTGGGLEVRDNLLLDLAIQKSSLVHDDDKEADGGKHDFARHFTDSLHESLQPPSRSASSAPPQRECNSDGLQPATPATESDLAVSAHHSGIPGAPPPAFKEKSTSTDSPKVVPTRTQPSACHLDRSRHSPPRRKPTNAASSFDRVAAWVKDVSCDLGHVQDEHQSGQSSSHSHPESRSSSCHRSCCSRRHRSHRKKRHHRHHRHHRRHETACAKCAEDTCTLCDVVDRCCSRICQKCSYCYEERAPTGKHASEPSNHGSACSAVSRAKAARPHPHPAVAQSPQRCIATQKAASVSPDPVVIQRTVSFPWIPIQMSRSSTAHSSVCQPPPPPQPFWSPMYAPQPPPPRPAPVQYHPWSLPTSPYLQSSMQVWSAQLPLPSSSDLSQTAPHLPYHCAGRQSNSVEAATPAHTSSSSVSAPLHETKKSKFFTLPSILCTLRRWHARRKDRRSKKSSDTVPLEKGVVVEREGGSVEGGGGGGGSLLAIPLRTSASLPGAYSRPDLPRASGSDLGFGHTPQYYPYYSSFAPHLHPMFQQTPQMCAGDPSAFMSQMRQSLSTYRTSIRSGGMAHKDNRGGDRGSSGYESCGRGLGGGSGGSGGCGGGAGAGGSSEVSSAHTDSVDSFSSCCQQQQHQHQFHSSQEGVCSSNQRFLPSTQHTLSSFPKQRATNVGNQNRLEPMPGTGQLR